MQFHNVQILCYLNYINGKYSRSIASTLLSRHVPLVPLILMLRPLMHTAGFYEGVFRFNVIVGK